MNKDLLELNRCRDAESVVEITDILDAANISYKVGSTATNFDITTIGTGSNPEVIISVVTADYTKARTALEEEYAKTSLPEDHYLLSFSDEEITELIAESSDWGAFDVAHARILAQERGINLSTLEKHRGAKLQRLKEGKTASPALVIFGWIFGLLGGLLGIGIGWSLYFMKEKTPEGVFHTYDKKSRETGKHMFYSSFVMFIIWLAIRISTGIH